MKKMAKLFGFIALAAVIGLMTGCPTSNGGGGGGGLTPSAKSITITGITGKSGEVVIGLLASLSDPNNIAAAGLGDISGNSVTIPLWDGVKQDGSSWTGSGSYIIMITFEEDDSIYLYTNGAEFAALNPGDIPKYNITNATSTIAFNLFREVTP